MKKYSFSIIGGGVIGCSVAYHLSKELGEDIVLLEKEFIASGSSGLAAGILSHQLWNKDDIELVRRSVDWIRRVSEKEEGFPFNQDGLLRLVCREDEVEPLKRSVSLQQGQGSDVKFLEPDEIADITSEIATDDVTGAAYCPDDSYVDPYQLCIYFAKSAEERGAAFFQKSEVRKIEKTRGGPFRLKTAKDVIECETVIVCAGPWSKNVGRMFGLGLPLKPYRTQVAITTPFMGEVRIPMVHDISNSFYMKPETGGTILAGNGTESVESDPDNFKERAGFDFMTSISENMLRRLPRSEKASLVRGWAGLCTATPDRVPLIGFHSEVEGLFLAVGFNALGVMRAPAIGEIVSELALGRRPADDVSRFDPNRFEGLTDFEIIQGFTL